MTNSQRGFAPILILLAIIAGAAVAGGGYYIVAKRSEANKAKVAARANASQSPEPSGSASPIPSISTSQKPSVSATPLPRLVLSQTPKPNSFALSESNAAAVKAKEPVSGWPIKLSSTIPIKGTIESLPNMVVLRINPVTQASGEYTMTVSGFPVSMNLYIYTNGYRDLEVRNSGSSGTLVFTTSSALVGKQWIIQDKE